MGKEEPEADLGKDYSAAVLNTPSIRLQQRTLTYPNHFLIGVFGGNFFFLQITDHSLMFLVPPSFFYICYPVAKLVSSFKMLGEGLPWWFRG